MAYLLLHRDIPQARHHLAFVLWPDSSESQARTNLRYALHDLRRGLSNVDTFVEVTARAPRWRADAPCWVDVAAFDDALVRGAGALADDAYATLREAAGGVRRRPARAPPARWLPYGGLGLAGERVSK